MKKRLCITVICVTLLLIIGCGSNSPNQIEAIETEKISLESNPSTFQEDPTEQVTYETIECKNICLMKFTNNSSVDVEVEVNFVFNNNGAKEDAGYGHIYCLGSGKSAYVCMRKPIDDSQMPIDGVTTEYSVTVNESGLFDEHGCRVDDISISDSEDENGNVTVTLKNNSDIELSTVGALIIYYNEGIPVWYDDVAFELAPGNEYYWTFDSPTYYDIDCTPIEYDSYDVFVNEAYEFKD